MAKIQGKHIPNQIKNLAINGAFDFWQEKAGTTTTVNTATTNFAYSSDMFAAVSLGSTVKNYSFVRSTNVPSFSQSGFSSTYSNLFTMITGIASPAASDLVDPFSYRMEGFDYAKIHGQKATFGFWINASVAGNYNFSLRNGASSRSYVTTFAVGANSWEYKKITVQLETSGAWNFDNSIGLHVDIGAISGSTYQGSADQWQNGNILTTATATNWQAISGATLRIAQFSIVEGSMGLGPQGFIRAGDTIQDELAMCQRYLYVGSFAGGCVCDSSALIVTNSPCELPVQLRAVPTYSAASFSGMSFSGVGNGAGLFDTPLTFSAQISSTVNYFQVRTNNPNARATGITGTIAGTVIADARF